MTTKTDVDPMLAKVRKLLAKAADPATTPEEAESYTAKAAALVAAYGIDQALLAQTDPGADPLGDRVVPLDAPYAADKGDLLSVIAHELRCRAVRRIERRAEGTEITLHLFGHASDLDRVEVLFTSLLLQATRDLTRTPVPRDQHAAAFRRSWLAGFSAAIGQRLSDAERRAATEAAPRFAAAGSSAALVLASRTELVEAAMHDAYPRLRTARPRSLSGSGGRHGWDAGQRADLGERSRLARGTRGILPA
ncbi:DUF2786 domain-containing protein [Nocardioides jiangxiensis]|uniref:DUF2786 domain-containing protein n=1 Tax=Nocardioides jiangxiensis TaxID=3064524 RepID=A0ABT9B1H4_9ACTN|nr:DUF2786 domain-containing protein [Nocardioides sp. WY-20]MDO7868707.1 DUF2786 domain-containing protein [Nocardioides sp. WY-20]